jgi:hypothetical protein
MRYIWPTKVWLQIEYMSHRSRITYLAITTRTATALLGCDGANPERGGSLLREDRGTRRLLFYEAAYTFISEVQHEARIQPDADRH